jgi:SPP1 gp7 family putative phage head morphogenesis protein
VAAIRASGHVSASRARLIARTEIARATTEMTRQRAEAIGSEGYIWHSSHDGRVRESHLDMDGSFVRWDSPPTLDGLTGHCGQLPNCRCWPEPLLEKARVKDNSGAVFTSSKKH